MTRYFFDVYDGKHFVDDVGTELSNLRAVRLEALGVASDLLRGLPEEFGQDGPWQLKVRDEHGKALFELSFQLKDCGDGVVGQNAFTWQAALP